MTGQKEKKKKRKKESVMRCLFSRDHVGFCESNKKNRLLMTDGMLVCSCTAQVRSGEGRPIVSVLHQAL